MQPLGSTVAVAGQALLVGCWLPRVGIAVCSADGP